jgi:long-chain acyl-CoA synthetase
MLSEKNICSCVNAACATVNFSPSDVTVSVLPLHHTYEMAIMLASLTYGLTVCINDSLRHLMRNFANYQPTGLVLVPLFVNTMHKKIWDEVRKKGKEKLLRRTIKISESLRRVGIDMRRVLFKDIVGAFGGRLEKIISGGAPLNPEMVKNFDAFGIQICEGYGITECSPLISVTPYYAPCPGSVGPAVPCCEARIAPDGCLTDEGFEEGEIQVKGDNVMLGYYNNPDENAKAFTEDGWYRTGDVGYIDAGGYIHITGRLKSVIVLENGKNVFPEEIEEYLENIEEISEVVVVGRKGEDGETINLTAIVYPNQDLFPAGTESDAIHSAIYAKITELNKKLPSFKKIKALELREVEFEKTTSRKIKRHLVK